MTLFGGNRSISVSLSINPAPLRAGLAVAKKEMSDFARAGAEASQKHKRSYDELAHSAAGIGIALLAAAGVAIHAFSQFDKSLSRVKAATQATTSQMGALRQAAIKAGADTQYSATQAADAITEMAKAGVGVKDILGGGLKGALDLAAAGELDVSQAAEIAATTLTQFALKGSDMGRVADVLAAGAGKAQGSVQDMGLALSYAGIQAKGMGLSLEDTVGALALFSANGLTGEKAGTALRGILASLSDVTPKAAKKMSELGISVRDSSGSFIGVAGTAQELHDKLKDLDPAARDAALGIIFNTEQIAAARILYDGAGKQVLLWTDRVRDAGYASRQAGELMNNLAGDVEKFQGSVETAFISSGAGANEGLRALTQGATGAVNAFGALPDSLQRASVVAVGLSGVVITAGAGLAIMTAKAKAARVAMTELGISSTAASRGLKALRFGLLAITAVQLLPGMAEWADKNLGLVSDNADTLESSLAALAKTGKASGDVARLFGEDFEGAGSAWNKFSGGFFTTGESVADTVERLSQKNDNLAESFFHLGDSTQTGAKNLEAVGESLAQMVDKGDVDQASNAFLTFAQNAGFQGDAVDKLLPLMPAYRDALNEVRKTSGDASITVEGLAKGQLNAAAAADRATKAVDGLISTTENFSNLILGLRGDARGYEAALDDVTESIKSNGKSLDITTEKGRANQEALDAIARAGVAYAESTLRQTGSGEKFRNVLVRTRADLVKAAEKFGLSKGKAEAYADSVLRIPSKAETKVVVDGIEAAQDQLDGIVRKIGIINGRAAVIKVDVNSANVREGRGAGIGGGADGGLIAGAPSKIDNRIMKVATGEFIVNATQTAKHLPILHAINQGSLPGFASGGFNSPFGTSEVQQRYEGLIPQPITPSQYAAAMKAAAAAQDRTSKSAISVRNAERDLAHERRDGHRTAESVRDAEDRLRKARISYAAATRGEAAAEDKARDAVRRKNYKRGFNLGLYANALGGTVHQAEAYRRNLGAVSKRGGSDLAAALEAMGADGAPLIAALVHASPGQFRRIAGLLKRLDPSAFGGAKVTRFADGGLNAGYATGWRVFGEPTTGGEAYIPLAASKQARSRALTADVAGRLGGQVTWSTHRVVPGATGVSAAPTAASGAAGGVSMNVGTVQLLRGGPEDVARDVMFAVRQLGG